MNQHQQIMAEMERQMAFLKDAIQIAPSALAHRVYEQFSTGEVDPHIEYTSLEHFKHMARVFLRRNEADDDDNPVHLQAEFPGFSGHLQDRYPLPRKAGEEPVYKLRSHMTASERAWNAAMLRKAGQSRLEHADALEAEGMGTRAA